MSDAKIVELKLADKKKPLTLPEILTKIMAEWAEDGETAYDDFRLGALVIETNDGIRLFPLKEETTYTYIGLLEVAKNVLVENMYDYEDE